MSVSMDLATEEIYKKVETLALPVLAAAGIELVELNVARHKQEVLLQFTADRPTGGITMEECAALNRAIVEAVDKDGFLGENYSLEFSSPGLDRPLATHKDFMRNVQQEARLWLREAVNGKKEVTGVITEATAELVTLSVKNKGEVSVPLGQIIKAMLVI